MFKGASPILYRSTMSFDKSHVESAIILIIFISPNIYPTQLLGDVCIVYFILREYNTKNKTFFLLLNHIQPKID